MQKANRKRTYGKVTKKWQVLPKDQWVVGTCKTVGCGKKSRAGRAKWCEGCNAELRRMQLRNNYEAHMKRVKAGHASHHLVYRGKPTPWAINNPTKALKLAKTTPRMRVPVAKYEKMLKQSLKRAA